MAPRLLALSALLALTVAAPAHARAVPLDKGAEAVRVTGDRVSWLVEHGDDVQLRTVAPGAAAPVTVATLARRLTAGDDAHFAVLATSPTSWAVGLRDGKNVAADPDGYTLLRGERVSTGTWAAPATVKTLVDCGPPNGGTSDDVTPLDLAYAGEDLVVAGPLCGPLQGLVELPPAPAAPIQLAPAAHGFTGFSPIASGSRLAYFAGGAFTVRDTMKGTTVSSIPVAKAQAPFAVDDDGTFVFAKTITVGKSAQQVSTIGPGAGASQALTGAVSSSAVIGEQSLVAGGGNVLFEPTPPKPGATTLGLSRVPTAGGTVLRVGEPGAGPPRVPLSVSASSAAFTSTSCAGVPQVTFVDLAAPATGVLPGCPVQPDATSLHVKSASHSATLSVRCPNGCAARLGIYVSLKQKGLGGYVDQHLDNSLATAKLSIPASAGAKPVTVTLSFGKQAQKFVKKAGGLKGVYFGLGDVGQNHGELPAGLPTLTVPAKL